MIFGANSIGIGMVITLRDQFTRTSRTITNQMTAMHGNAQKVQAANLRTLRNMGAGAAIAGATGLSMFSNAYKAGAKYDFIIRTITSVLREQNDEMVKSADAMKTMDAMITKLGTNSIYTIEDVASAMEYLVRTGFSGKQGMAALPGVVNLGAAAGGAPIRGKGGIGDILAAIMREFNLGADQSVRVANVLAKAANMSASDISDMGQALKYSAGNAHQMGFQLEELVAIFATLSNAGLKSGIAGRGVNAMMSYLNRAASSFRTTRQADAFKAIGLSIEDIATADGKLKPMIEIIKVFQDRIHAMSKIEASGALSALFMMRGEKSMLPLLEKSLKIGYDFRGTLEQLSGNINGYAERIAEYQMAGPEGTLRRIEDTMQAFKIKVAKVIEPYVEPILDKVLKILQKIVTFVESPLGKVFVPMLAAMTAVVTVGGAMLFVLAGIRLLTMSTMVTASSLGKTLTWAWTSAAAAALRYSTATKTAMLVNTPFGARWKSLTTGRFVSAAAAGAPAAGMRTFSLGLGRATGLLGVFGNLLKVAMGPIGFIVTILSGLVGFFNILKGVMWALGTAANMVYTQLDLLFSTFKDRTYKQVLTDSEKRQSDLLNWLNFDKDTGILNQKVYKPQMNKSEWGEFKKFLQEQNEMNSGYMKNRNTYLQGLVTMDSNKVGQILSREERKGAELRALLGIKD